jgi:uncharacterized membrane protein
MMIAFKVALYLHVLAGAVALSVFWLPLLTKKGGGTHRRVGWVYVIAAATIAVTGFVNCARMLTDSNPANDRAASAQLGIRAIRTKRRTTAEHHGIDLVLPALLVVGGVALAAFGVREAMPLYVIFAALGVAQGASQLRFWLRAPATRTAWFFAHMTGMGTSCITTVTAFLVVNAHRFGLGTFDLLVWTAPGVVGGVGLGVWRWYYEHRFAGALSR